MSFALKEKGLELPLVRCAERGGFWKQGISAMHFTSLHAIEVTHCKAEKAEDICL